MADWDLDTPPSKKPGRPEQPQDQAAGERTGDVTERPPIHRNITAATFTGAASGGTPPATKSRRRLWPKLAAWIGAGLALLLVGALIGFFIARSQEQSESDQLIAAQEKLALVEKALSEAEDRNWMYYRKTESLTTQLADALANGSSSTSTTAPAPVLPGTYRDGIYLVGADIAPGTYDGTVTAKVGYWARLKGTDGVVGSIIANALPRGPFVLTIIKSDKAVELRGVVITAQ